MAVMKHGITALGCDVLQAYYNPEQRKIKFLFFRNVLLALTKFLL